MCSRAICSASATPEALIAFNHVSVKMKPTFALLRAHALHSALTSNVCEAKITWVAKVDS